VSTFDATPCCLRGCHCERANGGSLESAAPIGVTPFGPAPVSAERVRKAEQGAKEARNELRLILLADEDGLPLALIGRVPERSRQTTLSGLGRKGATKPMHEPTMARANPL
jgi:hypothetical protein